MDNKQNARIRALTKAYNSIREEEDRRKGMVITKAYRGLENREFTSYGVRFVHNVKGQVLAISTKPEKIQEFVDELEELKKQDDLTSEQRVIIETFLRPAKRRITALARMQERNQREVNGVDKSIIRARIKEYQDELNGMTGLKKAEIERLEAAIRNQETMVVRAQGRWEDSATFDRDGNVVSIKTDRVDENGQPIFERQEDPERARIYEEAQKKLQELRENLNSVRESITSLDPNSEEYYRLADVIPELQDLLNSSDKNLRYIKTTDIARRIRKLEAEKVEIEKQLGLSPDERKKKEDKLARLKAKRDKLTPEGRILVEDFVEEINKTKEEIFKEKTGIDWDNDIHEFDFKGADDADTEYGAFDEDPRAYGVLKEKSLSQIDSDIERLQKELEEDDKKKSNNEQLRIINNKIIELKELQRLKEKFIVQGKTKPEPPPRGPGGDDDGKKPGPGDDDGKNPGPGDDDGKKPGDDDGKKPGPGDDDGKKPGDDDGKKPGDDDGKKPGDDDGKGPKPGDDDGKEIEIPDDLKPVYEIDEEKIKDEYIRRRNDMYAKYHGDREYSREFDERLDRFEEHKVEIEGKDGLVFETIEDYPEYEEDVKFLLLDTYRERLERVSRYEAGDKTAYTGSEEAIAEKLKRDKEYIETNNHAFDKHVDNQRNWGTMGKYGERVNYLPVAKQEGILRKAGAVGLNALIGLRNLVSPIYRGVGKFVAQPFHRFLTGGKGDTPYGNNWYHRMVARRDYFEEMGRRQDREETRALQDEALEEGKTLDEVKPVRHPVRNWFASRINAIVKYREGNEAVLRAGAEDIREAVKTEHQQVVIIKGLEDCIQKTREQIASLEKQLEENPNAKNAEEVRAAIARKEDYAKEHENLLRIYGSEKLGMAQTDAISTDQHDKASKEVVTLKTTVIKGVVKGALVKYVGPKLSTWLKERTQIKEPREVIDRDGYWETITDKEAVDVPAEYGWIEQGSTTTRLNGQSTLQEMMAGNSGKQITGYYSVYGGESRPSLYTLGNNEKVTGIFQNINGKGTGLSDASGLTAPELTDRLFESGLMDASGVLRQDVTLDQILETLGTNADASTLGDLYVSVGDKFWARLGDLTEPIVEKAEPVWGVIKEAIHEDAITHQHWVEPITRTVYDTVENTRVVNALNTLAQAGKIAIAADGIYDLEENLRNTHSDVKPNKSKPRRYEAETLDGEEVPTTRGEYRKYKKEGTLVTDEDEKTGPDDDDDLEL